jgi:hypothetical protein
LAFLIKAFTLFTKDRGSFNPSKESSTPNNPIPAVYISTTYKASAGQQPPAGAKK